jgi:hypothetical protein
MATYINVNSGGDALLERVKAEQQAARFAKAEQDRLGQLSADKSKQGITEEDRAKGLDSLPYRRDLAAFSTGSRFLPVALNWKGAVATTATTYNGDALGPSYTGDTTIFYPYVNYTNTLSVCTPSPVSVGVLRKGLSYPQQPRISDFSYEVSNMPNNFPNATGSGHLTSIRFSQSDSGPVDQYRYTIGPDPILPVNAFSLSQYSPTACTAYSNGTAFVLLSLPSEPVTPTAKLTWAEFLAAGWPNQVVVSDYSFQIPFSTFREWDAWKTTFYLPQPAPSRYLFLRIRGSQVQQKQATQAAGVSFGSFYAANAYPDDPSILMRGIHTGEVNVVGTQARFARIKNTETGLYESFPFGNLAAKVSPVTGLPVIQSPYQVVIHTHQLPAYTTPQQLALSLSRCVDPNNAGGLYIGPSSERRWTMPPNFFAAAASHLDQSTGDVLTPDSFFLVLL